MPAIFLLSLLSFAAGPVLSFLAILFSLSRCRKPRLVVLSVIPLALTSVVIQLAAAALMVVSGFRDLAGQKSGAFAVDSLFAVAGGPLQWRLAEVIFCVAVAVPIAFWVNARAQGKEAEGSPRYSLTTLLWSVGALVGVAALVWIYHDVVETGIAVVNPCRAAGAAASGDIGVADISAMFSRRVILLATAAPALTIALIGIGLYCLRAGRLMRWSIAGSMVPAMAAIAWCAIGLAAEGGATGFLEGTRADKSGPVIYHHYSRSAIDFIVPSDSGMVSPPRGPEVQLPLSSNAIRFADADREDSVVLTFTRDGQLLFGDKIRIDPSMLVDRLKDLLANRVDKTVYVRADARARYRDAAYIFGRLRDAAVDDVGVLTLPRQPRNGVCGTAGLEVLLPEPPSRGGFEGASQNEYSQFRVEALRSPAAVPAGIRPGDPIVMEVVRSSGGVEWKINRNSVSSLNAAGAQLISIFAQRQERVVFVMPEGDPVFNDVVDAVDAAVRAGVDKVGLVIGSDTGIPAEMAAQSFPDAAAASTSDATDTEQRADHAYSMFGPGNVLKYFRDPPPPSADFLMAPAPPPPPPPPPPPAH